MDEDQVAIKAAQVATYMRQENAVRLDEDTVGQFMTVYDLAMACDFFMRDWTRIKSQMLADGINICYTPGKGHYLGWDGEDIKNLYYIHRMATAYYRRAQIYLTSMESTSKWRQRSKWAKKLWDVDDVKGIRQLYEEKKR